MVVEISLNENIYRLAEKIEKGFKNGILRGGQIVCETAKELCPVDTGTLKNLITVKGDTKSAIVSANTDYAEYVEFGTSKTVPQPYLVPALTLNKQAVISAVSEAIKEELYA